MSLPPDWISREYLSNDETYVDPPQCRDATKNWLVGLADSDERHRIYEIPVHTSFGDIARAFRVGSHGAMSYSWDADETVELLARKLDIIQGIAPGRVVFADVAGFKVRFQKPISDDDYPLIEALFPEEEVMQAGLDAYICEWSGDGHPLAGLRGSDLLHLWWD